MKKTFIVIIVFLVSMGILLFISRAISYQRLPTVQTQKPSAGSLSYQCEISEYKYDSDSFYFEHLQAILPHGLTVLSIYVNAGDYVEEGDPIVAFYPHDLEYLQTLLEQKVPQDQELLSWTIHMIEEKGIWHATVSGLIASCSISKGDVYMGISPIINIIPNGEKTQLVIECPEIMKAIPSTWHWNASLFTDITVETVNVQQLSNYELWLALPTSCIGQQIRAITLTASSDYARMIVPSHIIQQHCVPVIKEAQDEWGEMIYIVEMVPVIMGDSDEKNTIILSGISEQTDVIFNSDQPLTDGTVVRIE